MSKSYAFVLSFCLNVIFKTYYIWCLIGFQIFYYLCIISYRAKINKILSDYYYNLLKNIFFILLRQMFGL